MATGNYETSRVWRCLECEGQPQFEHAEMMQHMRDVHGFEPKTSKGTRQAVMFLDGSGFHSSTYEIEINGMKFMEYRHSERVKKNKGDNNVRK